MVLRTERVTYTFETRPSFTSQDDGSGGEDWFFQRAVEELVDVEAVLMIPQVL